MDHGPGAALVPPVSVALAVTVLVVACADTRTTPLEPSAPGADPALAILDGTQEGGYPGFLWLPPIAPAEEDDLLRSPLELDRAVLPFLAVEVCEWDGQACVGDPIRRFTAEGRKSEQLRVSGDDDDGDGLDEPDHFVVDWDTRGDVLDRDATYRITVKVDAFEVGHADVDPDVFVPLRGARTLPIKFRIEQGAVFVVDASGGVFTSTGYQASLEVLPGSLTGPVVITVEPITDDPGAGYMIPGMSLDFGPDGTEFDPPAMMTLPYDPDGLPSGVTEAQLRLYKRTGGIWKPIAGSTVDTDANAVIGPVDGFSDFGIGTAAAIEVVERVTVSDEAVAMPSVFLGITEAVTVSDAAEAVAVPALPRWTDPAGMDHWYEVVPAGSPSINWTDAKAVAESRTYLGYSGHLVTIMSEAEQLFLQTNLEWSENAWIGLADEDFDGVYTWVTGQPVWDLTNPAPSCLQSYCNWLADEPNNNGGIEWYVEMWASPTFYWNDIPNDDADIDQPNRIGAFIIEYDAVRSP